jgi:hypothetical protein
VELTRSTPFYFGDWFSSRPQRKPLSDIDDLNLSAAGVEAEKRGIQSEGVSPECF